MNGEDSYEGAVRRLRRLSQAGADAAPSAPALDPPANAPPNAAPSGDPSERLRDLEELATLACDDNERLTHELEGARSEIARLQRLTATLEETLAGAQPGEPVGVAKRGRGVGFYVFTLAVIGATTALLWLLRPWPSPHTAPPVAVAVEPATVAMPAPSPPATTAPAAPTTPVVHSPGVAAPTPPAAPVVPAALPAKPRHHHHGAKHRATHRHRHERAATTRPGHEAGVRDGDDPLGGVNL
jgi:hypothetical protein